MTHPPVTDPTFRQTFLRPFVVIGFMALGMGVALHLPEHWGWARGALWGLSMVVGLVVIGHHFHRVRPPEH